MERVFYDFHERVCIAVATRTSHKFRFFVENTVLFLSVSSFCCFLLSHRTFVYRGGPIKSEALTYQGWSVSGSCLKSVGALQNGEQSGSGVIVTHVLIGDPEVRTSYVQNTYPRTCEDYLFEGNDRWTCRSDTATDTSSSQSRQELSQMNITFSFSETKGFLLLSPETLENYSVKSQYVVISLHDTKCFSHDPLLRHIIRNFMGRDTVALNWIVGFYNGKDGYIYNHKTSQIIELKEYLREYSFRLPKMWGSASNINNDSPATESGSVSSHSNIDKTTIIETRRDDDDFAENTKKTSRWQHQYFIFKAGVLLSSLFLFFLTTTLVSFTLRETQDRMLNFTLQLQYHIQRRQPYANLIVSHVMESMVFVPIMIGIIFFLVDCFYNGDKFLSFIILSGVWICEVFSAISMRTLQSSTYFPQVFFGYFTLFHIYYFSNPFGFSYAALLSTVLFLLHSMIFFWNRYELPAIMSGKISRERPRMTMSPQEIHHNVAQGIIPTPTPQEVLINDNENMASQQMTPRRQRIANAMSYPSMSSLGRISVSSQNAIIQDDDDLIEFQNGEFGIRGPARSSSPLTTSSHQSNQLSESMIRAATEAAARAASGELTEPPSSERVFRTSESEPSVENHLSDNSSSASTSQLGGR